MILYTLSMKKGESIKAVYYSPIGNDLALTLYSGPGIAQPDKSLIISDSEFVKLFPISGRRFKTRHEGIEFTHNYLYGKQLNQVKL